MMLPRLHQRDEQDDASRGNAQSRYRKERGYITYADFNAALPQDQVAAAGIPGAFSKV